MFTLLTYPVHLFSVHTRTLVEYLHIHYTWNMHLNDSLYIDPKRRRTDVLFWGLVPWPALDPRRAYGFILNIVDRSSLAAWWIFWLDMVWLIFPQKPGYDTLLGKLCLTTFMALIDWRPEFQLYCQHQQPMIFMRHDVSKRPFPHLFIAPA